MTLIGEIFALQQGTIVQLYTMTESDSGLSQQLIDLKDKISSIHQPLQTLIERVSIVIQVPAQLPSMAAFRLPSDQREINCVRQSCEIATKILLGQGRKETQSSYKST